jgi:hypothetical protein
VTSNESLQVNIQAMQALASVEADVLGAQEEFAKRLQQVLNELAGRQFDTLAEKQDTARRIQAVLSSINRKIRCTKCGEPAGIKVVRSLSNETGVFQFSHSQPKASTHQGPVHFPMLSVVPALEDRRYKNNRDKTGDKADTIVNKRGILDTDWMGE